MNKSLALVALGCLLLAACTERPQTIGTRVHDEAPYTGAADEARAFRAAGWTVGNPQSWRDQLRVRTQRGQNEYNRM